MQEGMSRQSREIKMQWHSLSLALFNSQKSNNRRSFNWLLGKVKAPSAPTASVFSDGQQQKTGEDLFLTASEKCVSLK